MCACMCVCVYEGKTLPSTKGALLGTGVLRVSFKLAIALPNDIETPIFIFNAVA